MVTGYYTHVFGPKLRQRLESWNDIDDMLDLRQELAMLRSVATDLIHMYAIAVEDKPGSVLITGQLVTKAMNQVRDMCSVISRIEATRDNLVTRDTLSVIARQLTQAAYDTFGADERTDAFLLRLSEVFFDPTTATQVSPERLVELMLDSVPALDVTSQGAAGNGNGHDGNGNGNGNGHGAV